eukprot:jgi/Bigna1/135450/aug1.29_g10158
MGTSLNLEYDTLSGARGQAELVGQAGLLDAFQGFMSPKSSYIQKYVCCLEILGDSSYVCNLCNSDSSKGANVTSELASQRKSDPERPPTATSYALANGHREMENQFDLLLKMPTEASQVPANKGSAATMKASSSRKREEFLEISKEMSRIASGVKLEQVRPESPKARSSKGKTKKPDLDPRLIGKSSAQKLIMKQLEEYRENEQARKELKSRAESHMGAKSVGQEYVRSNKKAVAQICRKQAPTVFPMVNSKTKHGNLVRMRKLELEQPNRKQKRFAKNWLTILTDNSLDFMKLQTDEEKRNKVPAWLVRRRVNSTRNAIGSFWRCLLVQRLLDDFRGQLVSIAEEAAYRLFSNMCNKI